MLPYVVKETRSLVASRVVKGGIILSHLHRPIAITGSDNRETGRSEQKSWDSRGIGPQAGSRQPPDSGRGEHGRFSGASRKNQPSRHPDLRPVTPTWDFRPLESPVTETLPLVDARLSDQVLTPTLSLSLRRACGSGASDAKDRLRLALRSGHLGLPSRLGSPGRAAFLHR
ncbi:unnamed protein product [Rangifer tarandus platyrhynchus]|uniref:Uncharacterized protein n=1 Tax=Rangifer tarandus platyrhynchus TaxID=3082113 RepID=A0AC59YCR0_RANTA